MCATLTMVDSFFSAAALVDMVWVVSNGGVDVEPEGWKLLALASNIVQIIVLKKLDDIFLEMYRVLFYKFCGLFFVGRGLVFRDKFG